MSGHSKWSKVKHQKAVTDVAKSAAFTKASRAITLAVREGGGVTDPDQNFHLRLAVEKARAVNMPKENIDRAIAKAAGSEAGAIEQMTYEGYGPGGVAVIIEAATDNRQRTVSQIKNVLDRFGGNLASPGAVNFMFTKRGVITVPKEGKSFDAIFTAAIDAGADDVVETEDVFELYTAPAALMHVKRALEAAGASLDNAVFIMHPTTTIVAPADLAGRVEELVAELESLDDVQMVYTNMAPS